MPLIRATVDCPIHNSFRVQQVAGLFDVPLAARARESFCVEVPGPEEDWQIGLVVGPSGSGKTTVARRAFGDCVYRSTRWPEDAAVVDCFGDLPIKQITGLLTAVGFSSPPAWVKPYAVLSGGEQFRCDLARALSISDCRFRIADCKPGESPRQSATRNPKSAIPLVVFDEFTSVVDRTVAQIGSAAIAKMIRTGHVAARFVAVTCHYDVAQWLEPDWVVDMATQTCQRRRLRRPAIDIEIFRCRHTAWKLFARHHYLTGQLCRQARCYLAVWRGEAVAFCATLPIIGRQRHWRITRIVTLPDYQGLGIGMKLAEGIAEMYVADGLRMNVTASHPALLAHCRRSPRWRTVRVMKTGSRRSQVRGKPYRGSAGRAVVSFEFVGALECGDSSPL